MTAVVALAALPWVAVLSFLVLGVRLPRPLPPLRARVGGEPPLPSVSVVVPARNEARNIQRVLASLAASDHPDFEIVVVDDRSEDGTAELARQVPRGTAHRILVLSGADLPEGWLGKPWACHQGATAATGDLLLFTDADTWHGPQLLRKAVWAMEEDSAHLLSVAGRQLMLTFWERLVQPQIFMGMLVRYRDQRDPLPPERWRSAIANGQYILVRRPAYEAEGGHGAVRGEVVEDMRLAQRWVRRGRRVSVRMGERDFATRMYASLGELVEGWSKNILLGGLATLPEGWLRRWVPLLGILTGWTLWLAPPLALVFALVFPGASGLLPWATGVVGLSALTWALISRRMGVPAGFGLLYPLGAAVASWILVRAWILGGTITWKGRRYSLDPRSVMGEP